MFNSTLLNLLGKTENDPLQPWLLNYDLTVDKHKSKEYLLQMK